MSVATILGAANLFARLELPVERVEVATVRSQYRRLALAVHPDKCQDGEGARPSSIWEESTQAARDLEEEVAKARQTEPWPGAANELLPDYQEPVVVRPETVCVGGDERVDADRTVGRSLVGQGITEEEHDEAMAFGLRTSTETQVETAEETTVEDLESLCL
eukprot:g6376.t1